MLAVSGGLIFIGYQLLVYGASQVRGDNAGFFDILWPGRYKGAFPDSSGTGAANTNTGSGTDYMPPLSSQAPAGAGSTIPTRGQSSTGIK